MTTADTTTDAWGWGPNPHADLINAVAEIEADGRRVTTARDLAHRIPPAALPRFADGLDLLMEHGRLEYNAASNGYVIIPAGTPLADRYPCPMFGCEGTATELPDTYSDTDRVRCSCCHVEWTVHENANPRCTNCGGGGNVGGLSYQVNRRCRCVDRRVQALIISNQLRDADDPYTWPDVDDDQDDDHDGAAGTNPYASRTRAELAEDIAEHGLAADELGRRIADAKDNIRAADTKAALLLFVPFATAVSLAHIPSHAGQVATGSLLAVAVLALLSVVRPRTQGARRWHRMDVDDVLIAVYAASGQGALAGELSNLSGIAARKYQFIQAAIAAIVAAGIAAGVSFGW